MTIVKYKAVNPVIGITVLGIAVMLAACDNSSTDSNNISIPTEREYQIISSETNLTDRDYSGNNNTMQARMILKYQLQSTHNDAATLSSPLSTSGNFIITPSLLQFADRAIPLPISNIDERIQSNELSLMIKDGFNLSVNEGEVMALSPIDKPQEQDLAKMFEQWDNLKSLFQQVPMLPVKLEPKVGFSKVSPKDKHLTWTVEQVTEDTLVAVLQGENTESPEQYQKTYGAFEVDRKTGWLNSLVLINQSMRNGRLVNHRLAMAPKDKPFVMSIIWHAYADYDALRIAEDSQRTLNDIHKDNLIYQDMDSQIVQALLPEHQGIIDNIGSWGEDAMKELQLRFVHGLTKKYFSGEVLYQDIQAFDDKNNPIDIQFWQHNRSWVNNYGGKIESASDLLPIGWDNTASKIKKINHISAKLTLIPEKNRLVTRPWSELLAKPYHFGGASLQITLIDANTHLYKVVMRQTAEKGININFSQFNGQMGDAMVDQGYPTWLSASEQDLINVLFKYGEKHVNSNATAFLLKLTDIPETMSFYETEPQPQMAHTNPVTFMHISDYYKDLANPTSGFDYSRETDFFLTDPSQLQLSVKEISDVKDIKSISDDGHNFYIPMSPALAMSCKPEIEQGFTEGKQPVTWVYDTKALTGPAYHLASPDGVRRYFYDKKIQGKIHCQGDVTWQHVTLQPGERPWLVDIGPWLTQPSMAENPSELLKQYFKIQDDEGTNLTIRLPENSAELSIKDVLVDGKFISVSGAAAKVSIMQISAKPIELPYQFTFKPLP